MLHSGGPAALADLGRDYEEVFLKGPAAVEFLGQKVNESWPLWPLQSPSAAIAGGAQQGTLGLGGGLSEGLSGLGRFYTRAAIVCWPKSKR